MILRSDTEWPAASPSRSASLALDAENGRPVQVTNADKPPYKSGTFTDSAADDGAYWNVRKFADGAAIALSHEHDRDIDVFMDRETAVAFAHALLWTVDAESS